MMAELTTAEIILIGIGFATGVGVFLGPVLAMWIRRRLERGDHVRHEIDRILIWADYRNTPPAVIAEKIAYYGKPAIKPLREWFRSLDADTSVKWTVAAALEKLDGDLEAKKCFDKKS